MITGTEDYYRARAGEYDQVYDKPERQADLSGLRAWLAGLLAGRRVLEVAAGTGYWTAAYAGRAASVLATDVNAATLQVARGRRDWPATVRFAQADALDLTTIDGFDAAFAGFFWSHIPLNRLEAFLSGLAGRLERPATLAFIDNRYVEGSSQPVSRADADGNTYQQRRLANGTSWEVIKNFPAAAEIQARLAGLGQVTVSELTYYWTAVCTLGSQR